jgi:hypothetical protein
MDDQSRSKAIEQNVARQQERHSKVIARIDEMRHNYWRGLTGNLYDELMQSAEATAKHLRNTVPQIRICCAEILVQHWHVKPGSDYARDIRQIALGDPDANVRTDTIFEIARCYAATNDVELDRAIAGIAKNSSAAADERRAAYYALFTIRGVPLGQSLTPELRVREDVLPIPQDFDLEFIGSFLKG